MQIGSLGSRSGMILRFLTAVITLVVIDGVSLAQFRPPFRDPRRPPSTVPPAQRPQAGPAQSGNQPKTGPPQGSQTPNPQPAPRSDGPASNYRDQSPNP